jgi:hypothetical protein
MKFYTEGVNPMAPIKLTAYEKARLSQWIKENVDESVVPGDEGHGDGLAFNLIHLLLEGPFRDGEFLSAGRFKYLPEQEEEIDSWGEDRLKW